MRLLPVGALALVAGLAQAEAPASSLDGVIFATHSALGRVPVKSWKRLRDDRVVKQDLGYSCGAASLATLLNEYYDQRLSEEQLLKAMDKGDGRASFADMARAATVRLQGPGLCREL